MDLTIYYKILSSKETIGVTSVNDPKYAKVIVIVFKTLKSLTIPHFSNTDICLHTMNIWFSICSNID